MKKRLFQKAYFVKCFSVISVRSVAFCLDLVREIRFSDAMRKKFAELASAGCES